MKRDASLLDKGIKSRILVSLRVLNKEVSQFKLSNHLLGCTQRNSIKKTLFFLFLDMISASLSSPVYWSGPMS